MTVSPNKYPRLTGSRALTYGHPKTCACGRAPSVLVRVQTDFMRGTEDEFVVCDRCSALAASAQWADFYAVAGRKGVTP